MKEKSLTSGKVHSCVPKKDSARLCVKIQYEAYVFFEYGVQGIK